MKRLIVLFSLIFILVPCLSGWTMWVDNISEGEWVYFNVGSFSPSGGPISYQTLSDICASCNQNIVDHHFDKMYPFYDYPSHKFVAEIVTLGSYSKPRYVIRLRDTSSNPIQTLYFVDDNLYYVYAVDDTTNDHALGPLFSKLNILIGYVDDIEDYIDGVEQQLTNISIRINTASNRLLKTVDNSSFTAADLLYNSWKQLQFIGGYVDNVEDKLNTEISLMTSLDTNVASLVTMVSENHFMSSYLTDSDGTAYPYQLIPSDSASYIIGYLNSQYSGKNITVLPRDSSNPFVVKFNRAWLDNNRHIAISGRPDSGNTSYTYYLCDPYHVIFKVSADTYNDEFSQLVSAINQVSTNINNSTTNNSTNISTLVAPINSIITATTLTNTSLNTLIGGVGDILDAIEAINPSDSALIPYIDQLEPYTDDVERLLTYSNSSLSNLQNYTDGLEGLVTSSNTSLDNISSYSEDISSFSNSILKTNQAILAHLDSSDLTDDLVISSLVDDWGDHLVYTVLHSDHILSLFNAAFGDLPSNLNWDQARMFFERFYRGDE